MINRPYNTVLARLGLVAAVLATLLILAPAASAADAEYDYAEDREDAVATFSATDPDADAGDPEWSVNGVDAEFFEISDDGELTFKEQPDFETAEDNDEVDDDVQAGLQGAGDNVYQVTVVASGGKLDVAVTVTDVDEPGKVTIDQPQPQATRSLEAMGPGDPDNGVDEKSWQWSRSESADGPWTDITGATGAKRTPDTEDIGHYLRATVTYVDVHGDQSESGVTANPVEPRTLANARPEFDEDDIDVIEVPENKSGNIGEPIVASDEDNDELLYDVDTASTTAAPNDNALFSVDNNGQLSVKDEDGLDYESPGEGKSVNSADTGIEYTVVLRATDPSRASDSVTVTVLLTNVNEAPEFNDASKDQKTLYIAEDGTEEAEGPGIFTDDGLAPDDGVDEFEATDEDGTTLDSAVTYSLEGDDKDSFDIGETSGALTTLQAAPGATPPTEGLKANFEDKSSYSITIVAQSTDAETTDDDDRGTKYTRLDVTVKVVDREDTGTVKLSALQSQVDIPVVATHSDDDGGVTDRRWQWYRGGELPDPLSGLVTDGTLTATTLCTDDDPDIAGDLERTAPDTLCRIEGETAALYTPGSDDVDRVLHVVADYKDDFSSGTREQAGESSEAAVQASNPANTAPKFPDQDLSTPGDQSDVAMRSVAENEDKGTKVGEPIPAGDADRDEPAGNMELLTYTIDDTDNFSVNQADGQISTAVKLDHEARSMYTVMLTATDPSGATDTITVMIAVTDEDDPAMITADAEYDYAEDREDAVATFSATDPDADAGDPEWSVNGVDAEFFEISDDGELTFKEQPDFETAEDNDEVDDDVQAGLQGAGDNVYQVTVVASGGKLDVAVTVTDVDEPGKVTIDQPQPQATRSLEAMGPGDPDNGVDEKSWQWSRSESADGPWTDITGATGAKRTPDTEDIGHYLRATVTYVDVHGDQSESGVTANPVEPRTLANARPEFDEDDIDVIEVPENKSGNIGEPIVASDEDNDELLYDVDTASTTAAPNDNALFSVDNNGQLSVKDEDGLDYESPGEGKSVNSADTGIEYTVVLRATDPSRASDSVTVTVLLTNVNEAPEFNDASKDQKTLYIAEDGTEEAEGPGIFTDDGLAPDDGVDEFEATDEDGTTLDSAVTYSLEGDDKDSFDIGETSGALTTLQAAPGATPPTEGLKANFEDKSSYSITIVAQSTDAETTDDDDRGTKYTRLDVTVKVVDREDTGTVKLSALQSQVDIPVVATHSDDDGGVTDRRWQWYRGGELPDPLSGLVTDGTLTATTLCTDDDPDIAGDLERTAPDTLCRIEGETAALYTPGSDDVDRVLHVVADYKDDFSSGTREQAGESSEAAVQASNPANTAPKFPDQDLSTPGDQSDVAMRSVAENEDKGTKVGEPIPAGDADRDEPAGNMELLTYTIDDTDNFSVNQADGQISTAVKLDHEARSMYTVMLTATDPSGATDTITVMIEVTDADDSAIITPNRTPVFDDGETTEREVAENSEAGTPVGDPVAATDADVDDLTYELGGDDAMYFVIGEDTGQITVGEGTMLDYESDKKMYMVTVTANDGTGVHNATGSIAVTIMVTDVNDYSPMFDAETAELMVAENTEAGMPVGDPLIATDGDGEDVTYSLSGDDAMYFDIGEDTGQITVGEGTMLDYESDKKMYMVTVTADDGTGADNATGSIAVTIMVTDVNDYSPMFDAETAELMVAENTEAGMPVGDPLIATDGDGEDVTYSLSGDDAMYFDIDDMGQITVGEGTMLDYESDKKMYMVTVTADDGTGADNATGSIAVTIMVTDVNDYSPMFDAETAELMVAENTEAGMPVGDPLIATDGDGEDVTYSLSGDDAMYFDIDDMGQITVGEGTVLDYESDKKMYMVTVTADDGTGADNATGSIAVTIMVTDVNDYSPMFDAETAELMVAENTEAGMPVGDPVIATDGDGEDVTYSLSGDDAMYFDIDDMGQITVGEGTVLDYESDKKMYMVTVTADDGTGADNATGSIAVTIMVIDNTPPAFASDTAEVMVEENQEAGTAVGDPVTAFDVEGDTVTYSMESMYFEIDGEGQITTTMKLDYEAMASHTVTLTASNGEGSDSIEVTIIVIDNTPPAFASDTAEVMVEENQEAGTAVGDPVTAFDVEGDTVTYLMESMYFEIDGEGQITTTMKLDYETMASHTVTVTTSNGEGSDSIEVTIIVIDNTPPAFPSATANRSVEESQDAGTAVGDPVTASDAEGDTVTYSMESMYFEIDGEGQITTTMELDYETMTSHTVTVTASNGEGSDSIEVTIRVIDNPPPAFPSATANRRVDENLYAGAAVGDPVAADDAGDTVAYSIDGSDYFDIDTSTGQIMTTMKLDEEAMSSHSVTVTATDSGGETDSVRVAITVNDSQPGCDTVGDMGLVNDCEALLDSEDALGGSLNWADDTPMSDWDGVTMSDDRVTAVNLRDQGLDGMIPAALGRLSELSSLNLRSNADLSGEIPGSLNYLSNLTVLNLHSNSHTGEIPDLSGTSLVELYLPGNELTGSVPAWLNTMTDMTELWLWGNDLSGTLPDLSGMTSLDKLKLNGNSGLSGIDAAMLPGGLRWLIIGQTDIGENAPDLSGTSLTTLWMNETGLSGVIPVAGIPTSVTSLNLKDNSLSGAIPDMSGLVNLEYLRLHRNELSGDMPGTMGDLESIQRIWIYDNELTGIAAGFGNAADTLTHLYLSGNSFAEGTCLPGGLDMVANNDFAAAGLTACSQ